MEILPQRTQRTELKPNIQHPTSNEGAKQFSHKDRREHREKGLGGEKRGLDREDLALLFALFAFFVAKMGPYFVWGRRRSPSPFILSPRRGNHP
jgi:hypothetical protein